MGIIYMYTFPNGKQYIGQTKYTLAQRTAGHISEAKLTPNKGCISLNRAIIKYERVFTREVICESDDLDDLNFLERESIEIHKTMVPHGYNIRAGGNNEPQSQISIAKRAKKLRKNKDDVELPQHTKREIKRGTLRWRINNHPLCSNKNFDTKEEMLEFLTKLENGEITPVKRIARVAKTTPAFIYERRNGYVIEYKGQMLASFLDKSQPKGNLLERANMRVQELIEEGKIICN